jgi:hypothetical protein
MGVATATPARAQGVGFRGGLTVDPEQAFIGTYFETNELTRDLYFRPGVDAAFGSDVTIASLNFDLLYKIPLGGAWAIYQGGGPAVHLLRYEGVDALDVTGALYGAFGFEHESGFFTELRVGGGGRGHNLKFGVGFTIH